MGLQPLVLLNQGFYVSKIDLEKGKLETASCLISEMLLHGTIIANIIFNNT